MKEMSSIYFGHLKSEQDYGKEKLSQEAFYLGTAFELIKDDNYLNFTLVGGRGKVESKRSSQDKFDIYSFSTALKLGKEYRVNENMPIDPSIILGYDNIMVEDYVNGNGLNITTETTNVFNVTPEIKISGDIKGYKPYAVLGYNYNYYQSGEIKAENVILPNVEVENYVELRVGVDKTFNKELKVYGEILATRGDKDSVGAQIGLEYKF